MKTRPLEAWGVVGILWFVAMLNYLDRMMITAMREPIKADITMTDAQFGLLTAVFLWIYGALSPLGGYLADRFGRRWVVLVSLIVWSLVTWFTGHVRSFNELLLARAIMGVSEACYIPAALALINDYHRGSTRSLATGLHMSGIYTGAALGGLGGFVAEEWGWRAGFTIFGSIGVGYAILAAFFLKEAPVEDLQRNPSQHAEPSLSHAILSLFSIRSFWVLLVLNVFFGITNWGISAWLPTYLRERFHLGLGAAGLSATGYIQAASFLGVLAGGAWADRWSRTNPRARALVPALGFCVAGPFLYLSAITDTLPVALLGLSIYGLGRGFFDANHMPVVRQIVDERCSATAYGFLNFMSCAAGGVMIYVGGRLKDAQVDLGHVFEIAAGGLLVVGLLLLALKPQYRPQVSPNPPQPVVL
ncbi:MAG: MFS family permease/MFS family permease [Verrucomicrobia bacterium]|nr:MAG: MFS family permease/MFS family permease [Verrucomicrobiota bacterium]